MKLLFSLFLSLGFFVAFAQQDSVSYQRAFDSIMKLPADTSKVRALNDLGWQGKYISLEVTEDIADESIRIATQKGYTAEAAFAYKLKGIALDEKGLYTASVDAYLKAIDEYEKINDSLGVAKCEANIGMIYRNMKKQDVAIDYFRKSLKTFVQYEFTRGVQLCYANIGICQMNLDMHDSAEVSLNKAYEIMIASGALDPDIYGNLGLIYSTTGRHEKAREYLEKCVEIMELQSPNDLSLKIWYQNLGAVYLELGQVEKAIQMLSKAKEIAGSNVYTREMTYLLRTLIRASEMKGNLKDANTYLHQLLDVTDSIYSVENLSQINDLKEKYETEKKQLQIEKLDKENKLEQSKREQQEARSRYILWSAILLGMLLLLVIAGFLLKSRDNKKIKEQNNQIESQRQSLQLKNEEILSSIEYAKRIQTAILPPDKLVKEYFNDSFIFYRPKDIVAGDFYWMDKFKDVLLFGVADCTGHGVPGAMVSVVCHNALNRAVREFGYTRPGEILDQTRTLIAEQFSKSEENVRDGMDIALVALKFLPDKSAVLEYSGANNPLWIIRGNEITELKPMKQPVGKHEYMTPFETTTFNLLTGDVLYLFSDGYSDQFGGQAGKKFKSGSLRKLLIEVSQKPMGEQRKEIEKVFDTWKGELEQIDDICVIGVRI
ncbi:MAG: tetratricopeptide repeat protein [Bacteroidetes bacterium]|nr:tetratricopeptide repeat protein [Bacteroidota bacterium]